MVVVGLLKGREECVVGVAEEEEIEGMEEQT